MENPIRILCVFATLNRGGAENMCMNLYRKIDRTKIQFDFVKHISRECAFEKEIKELGGRIYTAPRYKLFNLFQYQKWWRRFFSNHPEYSIIHGHYFTISYIYFKIAHEFGLHTIGHSHSEKPNQKSLKFVLKRIAAHKIETQSDTCLACSNAAGRYIFPNKDFIILKNAIDASKYRWSADVAREVRKELSIPKDVLVIGTCGSFSIPKNPEGIIEIFAEIHRRKNNALLLWVGDGSLRGEIEKHIDETNLTNYTILTGVRPDVNRLMQAMDVFILPSFWEGLALVSIEAQAAGLPCYFSDTITRECAITNKCTFLPLNNYSNWANSILENEYNRDDTYNDIKDAGFDINASARWIQEFYLRIYNDLNEGCSNN